MIDPALFSNGINHPNAVAYDRMAQTWYNGLVATVPRKLQAAISGPNVTIAWSPAFDSDQLQSVTEAAGPWEDVTDSPNPTYTTNLGSAQLFFRVKIQ